MGHNQRPREHWVDGLSFAIVELAVEDYAKALKGVKRYSDPKTTDEIMRRKKSKTRGYAESARLQSLHQWEYVVHECEEFFRSEWFEMLCEYNGDRIMKTIRRRVGV